MSYPATSTKTDAAKTDASKSKTDTRPAASVRPSGSPDSKILHRLKPSNRRMTYPFESGDSMCGDGPVMHAVAFEQQNDRESEAECDALIELAIREEWSKAGFNRFRHLRVEVRSGDVKLRGRLGCYYHKQMAHSLIRRLHGIKSIENDIQVN